MFLAINKNLTLLRNHTHCQVAQNADPQTKTCQRVWLPQHTDRLQRIKHENLTTYKNNAGNIRLATAYQFAIFSNIISK